MLKLDNQNEMIRAYTSSRKVSKDDKNRKIYVVTLMIDTNISNEMIVGLTVKLAESIPNRNWSYNVMECDITKLGVKE